MDVITKIIFFTKNIIQLYGNHKGPNSAENYSILYFI